MNRIITKIIPILTVVSFFVFVPFTYAQTTQDDVNKVLVNIESERIKKLEAQLAISVPLTTDNPNHVITFADPSGKGVKLEIDGQGYKTIKSPYTLPSLGIGKHTLMFKFTDSESAAQTLEKSITVIPRPPILLVPENVTNTKITLKGTALAGSTVNLFLSSGTKSFRESTTVQTDGTWSKDIVGEFAYGIYTTVSFTSKNGISSQFSEPLVFEFKVDESNPKTVATTPIFFTFKNSIEQNVIEVLKANTDLIILMVSTFVLGLIIASTTSYFMNQKKHKKLESIFKNFLEKKDEIKTAPNAPEVKSMTIREKMAMLQAQKEVDQPKVEEVKEEVKTEVEKPKNKKEKDAEKKVEEKPKEEIIDEKKEETVVEDIKPDEVLIDKEEFLKEYKEFDPDNNKGEEVNKEKKSIFEKIKISLTSDTKK